MDNMKNKVPFGRTLMLFLFFAVVSMVFLYPEISISRERESLSGLADRLQLMYGDRKPLEWGENVTGVKTSLDTSDRVIALTLDACGGSKGSGYDEKLVSFLRKHSIPATLFINARWIDANPDIFVDLASDPLFSIQNHGLEHKPCSVNGRSVYGIEGTGNIAAVVREIEECGRKIEELTGKKPVFYRSGTAFYDEVAVKIAGELGCEVAGFSVLGDAGATWSEEKVRDALLSAGAGDIIICHMNHPESGTAEGLISALPVMLERGYSFVQLGEYPLR